MYPTGVTLSFTWLLGTKFQFFYQISITEGYHQENTNNIQCGLIDSKDLLHMDFKKYNIK